MTFDIVLVVAGDDYKNLNIVIENSNKFLNPDKIFIITPKKDLEVNYKNYIKFQNVSFIDEKEILDIVSIDFKNTDLPGFPNRQFWYYQQFLKMAFSYSKYCLNKHYLIWDADTIPLNNLSFFNNENKIFLTQSDDEYHNDYFDNVKNLISKNISIHNKSFISQHLMVNKKHMLNMISNIGEIYDASWTNNLLDKLKGQSVSLFSEYETYANFVLNFYKDEYEIRKLSWFRRGAFLIKDINDLNKLSKYYSYVAIEKTDTSMLKKIFYKLNYLITRKNNK